MILKSTLGSDMNNDTSTMSRIEIDDDDDNNVAKKFKPDDDLEDLRSEEQEETQTLKLVNPERYLRAPTTDRSQKNSITQIPTNLSSLKQEMFNWHVNTELVNCFVLFKNYLFSFFFFIRV
jgi:hypothetical protein